MAAKMEEIQQFSLTWLVFHLPNWVTVATLWSYLSVDGHGLMIIMSQVSGDCRKYGLEDTRVKGSDSDAVIPMFATTKKAPTETNHRRKSCYC